MCNTFNTKSNMFACKKRNLLIYWTYFYRLTAVLQKAETHKAEFIVIRNKLSIPRESTEWLFITFYWNCNLLDSIKFSNLLQRMIGSKNCTLMNCSCLGKHFQELSLFRILQHATGKNILIQCYDLGVK